MSGNGSAGNGRWAATFLALAAMAAVIGFLAGFWGGTAAVLSRPQPSPVAGRAGPPGPPGPPGKDAAALPVPVPPTPTPAELGSNDASPMLPGGLQP